MESASDDPATRVGGDGLRRRPGGRACSVTGRCCARFGECCGRACRACTDGRKVRVYARVMRLVSLLPSATEIVYALGLGDQLVGVTFECDEPPSARADKTVVVGGLDTRGMTPREIDEYVHGRLAAGGNLYTLHERALADLQPDLILTQDLCAVCALPSGRVVAALRARLAAVAWRVAGRPRPKVAVVEWVDPPFTAGHWVPDLVTAAGGTPVAAVPGEPSAATSWAEIANAGPELVAVAPCGYHLDGAAGQARVAAQALPGLPVWAIDADGVIVRPGPRLVTGVEALAAMLHPGAAAPAPPGTIQRVA